MSAIPCQYGGPAQSQLGTRVTGTVPLTSEKYSSARSTGSRVQLSWGWGGGIVQTAPQGALLFPLVFGRHKHPLLKFWLSLLQAAAMGTPMNHPSQ